MHPFLQALDPCFHSVRYRGERHPAAVAADGLEAGANCQVYAYAVLREHGLVIPPFRSSDLWVDATFTTATDPPFRPLDLLLVNESSEPYGAHVGVFVSAHEVLHLCQEVGTPVVWPLTAFAARARYATIVAVKRPLTHRDRAADRRRRAYRPPPVRDLRAGGPGAHA